KVTWECALTVTEGVPSRYAPMQVLMSSIRWDHLCRSAESLDLEGPGVPVQWECVVDDRVKSGREQAMAKVADSAAAVVIHAERHNEPIKVAMVFGAAHIPAVVDYLTGTFRYYVENAMWL